MKKLIPIFYLLFSSFLSSKSQNIEYSLGPRISFGGPTGVSYSLMHSRKFAVETCVGRFFKMAANYYAGAMGENIQPKRVGSRWSDYMASISFIKVMDCFGNDCSFSPFAGLTARGHFTDRFKEIIPEGVFNAGFLIRMYAPLNLFFHLDISYAKRVTVVPYQLISEFGFGMRIRFNDIRIF